MKKIICCTLVFVFCFCLCACGETSNDVSTYESDNDSQVSSVSSQSTSSTLESEQGTGSYKLPTINEFVDGYKSLFTLSDIREENGKITFKTFGCYNRGTECIGQTEADLLNVAR